MKSTTKKSKSELLKEANIKKLRKLLLKCDKQQYTYYNPTIRIVSMDEDVVLYLKRVERGDRPGVLTFYFFDPYVEGSPEDDMSGFLVSNDVIENVIGDIEDEQRVRKNNKKKQ